MTPFPTVIDNTIRSAFVACETRARYAYFEHRASPEPSIDTHAGGAFAAGLAAARRSFYERGQDARTALAAGQTALLDAYGDVVPPPKKESKSRERVAGALVSYFEEYPLGEDALVPMAVGDRRMIEFAFQLPFGELHPETGEPLMYAGRSDMVAQHAAGAVYVVDEKTAGSGGEAWRNQWTLDSQMTGYVWAARELGLNVTGAAVRGVILRKYDYGHEQVFTLRPSWVVERWLAELRADVKRMIEAWRTGTWRMALTKEICSSYNRPCAYTSVCGSRDPQAMLAEGFVEKKWNPLEGV